MENNNNGVTNFVLVGVGGQGIILASTIVSESAVLAGYDALSVSGDWMIDIHKVVSGLILLGLE